MDRDQILALTVDGLREQLEGLGLDTSGRKATLRDRLLVHFGLNASDGEESDYDDVANRRDTRRPTAERPTFTLRDIEDSLTKFNGSGQPTFEQWIEEFEDNAIAVQWGDLQRFIYGKQLLKGAAKLFVRSQSGISSWDSLKSALRREFGTNISSIEIHRALRNRRQRQGEDLREYLYAMMEIGKPLNLDDSSLIEYFIEGINDTKINKSNLYQATCVQDLKEQIKVYEKVRSNRPSSSNAKQAQLTSMGKVSTSSGAISKRCFNCGDSSHFARDCPRKRFICFKCGNEGHRASECKYIKQDSKLEKNSVNMMGVTKSGLIFKDICFSTSNQTVSALIDTGSDLCLMRYDTLMMLNLDVQLNKERRKLVGIGNSTLTTIGSFTMTMQIDGVSLEIAFHVTRERDLSYSLVIGNDVLKHVDLIIREEGALFREKLDEHSERKRAGGRQVMGRGRVEESPDDGAAVRKAVAGNCASASSGDSIAEDLDAFYAGMKDAARKLREGPNTQPLVDERPRRHAEMRGEDDYNQSGAGSVKYVRPQNRVVHECNAVVEEPVEREPASNIVELREEFGNLCLIEEMEEDVHHGTDLLHLGKAEAETVENLIMAYKPVKKRISPVEMKILLTDDNPVYERPRRMSYADRKIVDDQVAEGIIQVSNSNYASPVVLVGKKDGSTRLCCDYRRLNDKIVRDNFPMPMIDDVIEQLLGANVFSTLDLANGFFHVPVEVSSRKYTSFVTHNGQYEFRYVPFGISNSPAVFSRFVFAVLKDLIQNGTVIAYMDDLIIPSKDELEGIKKLRLVLKRSEASGLQVKWNKCQFLKRRVEFLGYIIANSTIQPSEAKTNAIKNFPLPNDKKSLQRFLGLTSYFRRFVENYAVIAKPLSDLLRRDTKFVLQDDQIAAFKQLQLALTSAPVLKLYNPKAVTEVHTDASSLGYGAVLLQKDYDDQEFHPIQYMSRKTKPSEEKYHSYELEVLAVIEALKKWRVYLLGIRFKIVTDCNAFTMTMKKRDVPLRVSRWAMFLQDFNYEIEHRSGTKMRHVDALSRISCLILEDSLRHRLKQAQQQDGWIRAVRRVLERDDYEDFYLKHDVLYKDPLKELIVVPSAMEEEIIKVAHRQGHFSVKRTQDAVERSYYIPQLNSKVAQVVKGCVECLVTNSKTGKKEGYLNPINKEDKPLGTFHIDHVGPMEPTKKAYNYILVVIDAFSKFVWLYPTRNTDAEAVVDRLQRQSAVFGNPKRIITDRGSAFTSNHFKSYCESEQIEHLLIATGVPRGNGQVERIHRVVVPMIAKLCLENPGKWYTQVNRVQRFLNSTPARSTKSSPFKILTGLEMRVVGIPQLQELLENEAIDEMDAEREEVRRQARENIVIIQEENRRTYNANRRTEPEYAIDELVAIKRTQYGVGLKLKPKYLGPYKIVKKMRRGRYTVEKIGDHEGPGRTTTVAEFMKRWDPSFGPNERAGWPNVGNDGHDE